MQIQITHIDVLLVALIFVVGTGVGAGAYSLSQAFTDGCESKVGNPNPTGESVSDGGDAPHTADITVNSTHVVADGYTFTRIGDNRIRYTGSDWVPESVVDGLNEEGWYVKFE